VSGTTTASITLNINGNTRDLGTINVPAGNNGLWMTVRHAVRNYLTTVTGTITVVGTGTSEKRHSIPDINRYSRYRLICLTFLIFNLIHNPSAGFLLRGENMIYTTGTIAISGNTLTGTGTNFTAAGSLIRNGCTVIALTSPAQVFQITAIGGATSLTVTPAASPAIPAGTKY
jgi:hypothetical protein